MSGFTQEYSERILHNIYDEENYNPRILAANNCPWPPLVDEAPTIKSSKSLLALISPSSFEPLPFTPSSTLSEDIECEMLKDESSIYSDKEQAEKGFMRDGDHLPKCPTATTLADTTQDYHKCVESSASPRSSIWFESGIRDSDANRRRNVLATAAPIGLSPQSTTAKSHESQHINEEDSRARLPDEESGIQSLAAVRATESRAATPKSLRGIGRSFLVAKSPVVARSSTPQSPNAMNRRNEQDPAFLRTLDALRSLDNSEKPKVVRKSRTQSMIPSPIRKQEAEVGERSQVSFAPQQRSEGTVRKYLSFVKRLRGVECGS